MDTYLWYAYNTSFWFTYIDDRRLYVYNKHNARAIPNFFSNFADYWLNLTICFSSDVINVIANKTLYLSMTNSRDLRDSYYTYIVWTSALKFFLRRISFIRAAARHRRRVMEFRKTAASRTAGREKKTIIKMILRRRTKLYNIIYMYTFINKNSRTA